MSCLPRRWLRAAKPSSLSNLQVVFSTKKMALRRKQDAHFPEVPALPRQRRLPFYPTSTALLSNPTCPSIQPHLCFCETHIKVTVCMQTEMVVGQGILQLRVRVPQVGIDIIFHPSITIVLLATLRVCIREKERERGSQRKRGRGGAEKD